MSFLGCCRVTAIFSISTSAATGKCSVARRTLSALTRMQREKRQRRNWPGCNMAADSGNQCFHNGSVFQRRQHRQPGWVSSRNSNTLGHLHFVTRQISILLLIRCENQVPLQHRRSQGCRPLFLPCDCSRMVPVGNVHASAPASCH